MPEKLRRTYSQEYQVHVAVDCIIFGFDPSKEELQLLLIKRDFEPEKGKWSLMGGFLKEDETTEEAARRVLNTLTGLKNVYMEQLDVFSEVGRDPGERTISVAYFALISTEDHDKNLIKKYSASWVDLSKRPDLIFDHDEMVERAINRLRYKASFKPIGFELLPEKFTMRQLQKLHEEIFGQELDKRNFSKKMHSYGFLERLDEKDRSSSRKGSYLYRFNAENLQQKEGNWIDFRNR
jgi:8-oxo-dGTP diphosphatase